MEIAKVTEMLKCDFVILYIFLKKNFEIKEKARKGRAAVAASTLIYI